MLDEERSESLDSEAYEELSLSKHGFFGNLESSPWSIKARLKASDIAAPPPKRQTSSMLVRPEKYDKPEELKLVEDFSS